MTIHRHIDCYTLPQLSERFNRPQDELRELISQHEIFALMDSDGELLLDEVGAELLRGAILGPDRDKQAELERMVAYTKHAQRDFQRVVAAAYAGGAISDPAELDYIRRDGAMIARLTRICNDYASAAGLPRPFDIEISR